MAKVGAIKHVIMREADAAALRKIAYRYNLVSDSAAIRFAIHELARRIEEEERRRQEPKE